MCSWTPRFSYRCPETRVRAVTVCTGMLTSDGWVRAGGYTGWVPGGLYRCTTQPPRCKVPMRNCQKQAACCRWQGGIGTVPQGYVDGGGDGSQDHPAGPVSTPGASLSWDPQNAASWPITARFRSIYSKVSQNGQVSPKYVHKASHSPCFHFGLQKSPLEFLRFPVLRAFSHKELMGCF